MSTTPAPPTTTVATSGAKQQPPDRTKASAPLTAERLNWLRAAVLGANDGIVSIASVLLGVVAATRDTTTMAVAAVAAISAGASAMAMGEYVSVSSQRDAELVARKLAQSNGADENAVTAIELTSPVHAAIASFLAFTAGGMVPTVVAFAPWGERRDVATFVAVVLALVVTGWVSARASNAPVRRAVVRVVVLGSLAMALTFGIGTLVGTAV
ncbi:MAG: VIT1/CCC1 transporter family protein [Micrococcales bacterium]|nr:VIT1/CCC1 transporter family protein [Micrococcales bacterium]MCL2667881.1 VIT1/CCC1 transporter family protein [Micrococcales bacterium]